MTRGAVLPVIGSADAPFQRIARELMGYYLVGFEPQAGDRDGKQHAIRVRVKREKLVSIRWRSVLNIPAKPPSTAAGDHHGAPLAARRARPAGQGRDLRASRPGRQGAAAGGGGGGERRSRPLRHLRGSAAARARRARLRGEPPGRGAVGGNGERRALRGRGGRRPQASTRCASWPWTRRGGGGACSTRPRRRWSRRGGLRISDLVLAPPGSGALRAGRGSRGGLGRAAGARRAGEPRRGRAGERGRGAWSWSRAPTAQALLRVPAEASGPDAGGVRVARVAHRGWTASAGRVPGARRGQRRRQARGGAHAPLPRRDPACRRSAEPRPARGLAERAASVRAVGSPGPRDARPFISSA